MGEDVCRPKSLRKFVGAPAGCPWDTRRDKRGSTGQCPETDRKRAIFAGTPAGVLGTPVRPGGFQKLNVSQK